MTRAEGKRNAAQIKVVTADQELMGRLVERTAQEVLEAEMTEALGW